MGLVERHTLVAELSPPFDRALAEKLVDEFVSIERRYIQRDWEPAELDGGQFGEILARILYEQDSGSTRPSWKFDDYCEWIEDAKNAHQTQHKMKRSDALHLIKVLRTIYKFRSQRGAVHISPTYEPNHMDARLVVECARWCMAETLRLFWRSNDREVVARVIRELLRFEVPCIGVYEDVLLVQRTDLSAEEEALILLHFAGEKGMTRSELGRHAKVPASSLSDAVKRLIDTKKREVISVGDRLRLTDRGAKRVREQLADKMLLE